MATKENSTGLEAAKDAIGEVIQRHVHEIGPFVDEGSAEHSVLSEWVLVMGWTDMQNGENYITMTAPTTVLRGHRNGLLFEALYHMNEGEE